MPKINITQNKIKFCSIFYSLEENIKNPTVQSSKDFHSIDLKELSKEKEASDQYEPYSNRKVEHPTT